MKTAIDSLSEFTAVAAEIERKPNEMDRIADFCDCFLTEHAVPKNLLQGDPFSAGYYDACKSFLVSLTGTKDYQPEVNERSEFLADFQVDPYVPSVYRYQDSRMLGDSFSAAGAILQTLDVRAGDSVLEYGAGDGQIALALARMGCEVSVIDVDERYLDVINRQAKALGVQINTVRGFFGDAIEGKQFDRILFYEAFHHGLDHAGMLQSLRSVLKPKGRLMMAGEPIIPKDSYWRRIVPFPWGPRLDGLSLRAMVNQGWCELGFQREYFVERMMRSGWLVTFSKCAATARGDTYVAELRGDIVHLGNTNIVESTALDDGWFDGEGVVRWTRGSASLGIDESANAKPIEITLHNFLPIDRVVTLVRGEVRSTVTLRPGDVTPVTLSAAQGGLLSIRCAPVSILEVVKNSTDDRIVGVAVSTLKYCK